MMKEVTPPAAAARLGGGDRLAVFAARFAGEDAGIDQAGHGDKVAAVADDGGFRNALVQRVLA